MAELNLIPQAQKRRGSGFSTKSIVVTILIFILLLVIAAGIPLVRLFTLKIRETSLKAEVAKGAPILKESQKLASDIENYKMHIAKVDAIIKAKPTSVDKIRGMEKYIVADVVFTSFNYGDGTITVSAQSKNYYSICVFTANLEAAEEYKDARISTISYDQTQGKYTCSITINY